ncbi:UNVERIFIED_CONTAM: hypothetical protein PYX00_000069 [Menopon gallinae]|uniref:Neuroblastoma-amplified sequence n=1 Tax=Menopon gallinae TaxID=328185 RepID=A0AAW2I7L4_9NEOP
MEHRENNSERNILYEVLTFAEWNQNSDIGLQKITLNNPASQSPFSPWKLFSKKKLDNKKYLQTEYPWQLAVSQDGKVIAILQESLLEIRTAKDEYSSVVGRAQFPCDQCPQLRKLSWSPDNTFLAVARDNGNINIYNILGCNIATVQPGEGFNTSNGNNNTNILQPVVGLLFLQPKFKITKWSHELLVIYNNGEVRSILLSSLEGCDYEESAKWSLEDYFPQGITSVAYHNLHHIILIAGPCHPKEHGITVWRMVNSHPFMTVVSGFERGIPNSRSFLRFISGYSVQLSSNTVIKMKVSPNGEVLACLHYGGDITFWQLPSLRLKQRWPLNQQPYYNRINPEFGENIKEEEYFLPTDICWWSDTALVVARNSGSITVCSTSTMNNLLGDSPEFLSCSPQMSSIHGSRSAVIALEREIENNFRFKAKEDMEANDSDHETSVLQTSIQAALYSFTDIERFEPKRKTPRITQRTYRLLAIKRTTPEELYARKIKFEDYDSALLLAQTYNLDCDLVYQKQWRSSTVNKESIYNFLDKIKNTLWVLNECMERVPDTIQSAKELLEFGLNKTDLNEDERKNLDPEQLKIVSCRRQILSYSDNLSLYQKIIGDPSKYDAGDYDEFRRKSDIMNTVTLARQENWLAVSIMFTFRGNNVLNYRLPILSNFPETLHPKRYRSLLPEIIDNKVVDWEVQRLRFPDWSEDSSYSESSEQSEAICDYVFGDDQSLRRFATRTLTPELVEEWYIRRIYEIEKNTGLVEYALSFASLSRERNVKALDLLLFNLQTLHCLVYVVQDQEITLSKLETLTELEQAKLLLSKTKKNTFVKDLCNIIHPFALRCEKQGSTTFYSLLRGLLLEHSEENLDIALKLFICLRDDNGLPFTLSVPETISLALDCLYTCQKADQVENGYSILECLPVRGASMTAEETRLHDKLDKLEKHLETCETLDRYNASKPLRYINENEENESVVKQLMQEMAKFTKDETLSFSDLLSDLQRLQSNVFTCVDLSFCYELVAFTQMTCECEEIILSAEDLLQCERDEPDKPIPFEKSIQIVLEAAKIHFERATNYDDFCIKLSQLIEF